MNLIKRIAEKLRGLKGIYPYDSQAEKLSLVKLRETKHPANSTQVKTKPATEKQNKSVDDIEHYAL